MGARTERNVGEDKGGRRSMQETLRSRLQELQEALKRIEVYL